VKQAQINLSTAQSQKQDLLNTAASNNQKLNDINSQINDTQNQINNLTALQKSNPAQYAAAKGDDQLKTLNSTLSSLNTSKDNIPDETEKLKQADNQIKLAQVNLDTANTNLAQSADKNVADFDGVVTAVNVSEGSAQASGSTSAGGAAVTIEDQSSFVAEVNLDKYSTSEIKLGENANVVFANKNYTGSVSYIAPSAQTTASSSGQTTTLIADIDITSTQSGLVEGFDADANILVGEVKDINKVPVESVKTDKNGKNYVFIVQNNKAVQKEIQLGLQSDTEAQINSGLSVGDKVILNPSASLQSGTAVKESAGGK
jgi:HlyD family secretion protein